MRIAGTTTLPYPRAEVWSAFINPEILRRATPGCQSLDEVAPDQFQAVLKIGVAGITGTYKGSLAMADKRPPEGYTLIIEGQGSPGHMKGSAQFDFIAQPDGSTCVSYVWEIAVGGLVASVGQRVLSGVAKMQVGQFFSAIQREMMDWR